MRRPRDSPGPLARIFGEQSEPFSEYILSLPWLPEPFPHKRLADLKVGVREVPEMSQNGAFHLVEEVLQSRSVCKSFDYIRRQKYRCTGCRCNFVSFRPRKVGVVVDKESVDSSRPDSKAGFRSGTAEIN